MPVSALLRPLIVALIVVCPHSVATADSSRPFLVGKVTKVVDGDTIDVQLASGPIRIRLYAIDAPERSQPHGKEATGALSSWVMGKQVEVEPFSQDRYDRMVGIVRVGDINVNAAMVRSGDAWAYRRYMKKKDGALCTWEAEARAARRGVWALSKAERIAPWEFRSRKKLLAFTDFGHDSATVCVAAISSR